MRRADRLFQIVQLLRQRRLTTAAELARELGVSQRTVYRYVADLTRSGVPIRGEAGMGYALERGYELPPLTFNHAEIEALVLGMRMVSAWADPELQEAAGLAMAKVDAVLPTALRQTLARTALYAPKWDRNPVPTHLTALRRAVAEHRPLRFRYISRKDSHTARTIEPVGLHFWGNNWSVAAWCRLREDWRAFRADRMSDVELLDATFDPEERGGLAAYLDHIAVEADETGFSLPRGLGGSTGS